MNKSLGTFERLISHRFRGFSELENTIEGAEKALDFGVKYLEFDIRVSRCGTPMIYHDEYALDARGQKQYISTVLQKDFIKIGGRFSSIPSFDRLLEAIAANTNSTAILMIDIKDAGFEMEIHSLVMAHGMGNRVIYVSWLPQALYQMHDIAPETPLCFSHWCKSPNKLIRAKHHVYEAKDGIIPHQKRRYIHGERSGYFVDEPIKGKMREIIKQTNGAICVPQDMVDHELVESYQADKIQVSTFSYTNWDAIERHDKDMNIDLYFIDNKAVFDAL